jgi:hypothetical protein
MPPAAPPKKRREPAGTSRPGFADAHAEEHSNVDPHDGAPRPLAAARREHAEGSGGRPVRGAEPLWGPRAAGRDRPSREVSSWDQIKIVRSCSPRTSAAAPTGRKIANGGGAVQAGSVRLSASSSV